MSYLSARDGDTPSPKGKGRKLTSKMLSFVDHYFSDGDFNGTKSLLLSDYKVSDQNAPMMAAELLNHPLVQAEIKRRQVIRTEKSEVKAEYLIMKLMQIIEDTQEGNPQAALRAIELAGKSIALWKERQEISGPDGAAIQNELKVKESVADFTSRISSLAKRHGTSNVVSLPDRGGAS